MSGLLRDSAGDTYREGARRDSRGDTIKPGASTDSRGDKLQPVARQTRHHRVKRTRRHGRHPALPAPRSTIGALIQNASGGDGAD